MGGWGTSRKNDVWSSENGVSWNRIATANWAPRAGFSLVVFNSKIWLIGGYSKIRLEDSFKDVWSFDDGTGDKIYVLGGVDDTGHNNDIWVYY